MGSPLAATQPFGTTQIMLIAVIVAMILLSGFLAMAETSLTRMSKIRAGSLAEENRRGSHALKRLMEHPESFLNPLLLLVLICHLTASTLLGLVIEPYLGAIGVLIGIVLEVVVVFAVSEAGPKTWALQQPDRAALLVAPFVALLVRFPPVKLISELLLLAADAVLPGKLERIPATSEQELLAFADAAVEEDVIEREERSMIHSIIEFGDTVVREVMVPRPDMITVDAKATVTEAVELAIAHGFSRIPVIRESRDDIAGILYAKDLMRAQREAKFESLVGTICRPTRFTPESKRVSELMREMQGQKYHMAIVLDEYGGTAGLVTLEDLIEELVGEIVDEYDTEEAQVERLTNGDFRVTSRMLIDELNDLLDVEWPSEDWDSVGGLMLNLLGHPASEGEQVTHHGYLLRAERVKGRRIGRVRLSRLPDDEDSADDIED